MMRFFLFPFLAVAWLLGTMVTIGSFVVLTVWQALHGTWPWTKVDSRTGRPIRDDGT